VGSFRSFWFHFLEIGFVSQAGELGLAGGVAGSENARGVFILVGILGKRNCDSLTDGAAPVRKKGKMGPRMETDSHGCNRSAVKQVVSKNR
jgi:hypothetical protein